MRQEGRVRLGLRRRVWAGGHRLLQVYMLKRLPQIPSRRASSPRPHPSGAQCANATTPFSVGERQLLPPWTVGGSVRRRRESPFTRQAPSLAVKNRR
jgi:hypothetical protein